MQNPGKKFEEDFKNSMPEYCMVHRLKDTAQAYNKSEHTKFTRENECDFFVFDSVRRILYCFECKSTKYKSMAWQQSKDAPEKIIKWHQIESLTKLGNYNGIQAGFICNFRDDEKDVQRCYFIEISAFNAMRGRISKKSFDEIDLIQNGAIRIEGAKKITRYQWDIDKLFERGMNI